jgi:phenylalanyl-tRNA synthetase beta chain
LPVVNFPLDPLLRLVNADAKRVERDDVPTLLHDMGIEVDEIADTQQFACARCDKIFERTDAQGPPLHCSHCGVDFQVQTAALRALGRTQVVRCDMLAVRPDIFDIGGLSRYLRGFIGARTGLVAYDVDEPRLSVSVDPNLSKPESLRPYIACAVLRQVELDHERIKLLMNLQEDLHWALGRNRKLASIGVYDFDALHGTRYRYDAVAPDGVRFVPLGFDPAQPESALTPREILERHKTGMEFAHLLRELRAYPLLRDERGTVLSMPPIINSESTRVTLKTRQCFVDVTGLSQRSVDRALAILVANLKEIMPQAVIEAVTILTPAGPRQTPDLNPTSMGLSLADAAATLGAELDLERLRRLLERMGHDVIVDADRRLIVSVPAWRNDVMHPVDLIEDAAVAYGYDKLEPQLVPTFTIGAPRQIEEQSALARRILAGLGLHQVITLTLTSEAAAFRKWRLEDDSRAVRIENPISVEQTICRVNLLPGLLETLAINKQYDLPQQLFEVGDCCFLDEQAETGAREERTLAAALIGPHVGYADIRAICDALGHELDREIGIRAAEHASFIPGRAAELVRDGRRLGIMGELHPEVLENYGLKHPVAVLELSLEKLLA